MPVQQPELIKFLIGSLREQQDQIVRNKLAGPRKKTLIMSARRAKPDLMMMMVASLYAEYSLLFVQNPAVQSNKQRPG